LRWLCASVIDVALTSSASAKMTFVMVQFPLSICIADNNALSSLGFTHKILPAPPGNGDGNDSNISDKPPARLRLPSSARYARRRSQGIRHL
jgi:hypothetical protein